MHPKLAAAKQLGPIALIRRAIWRFKMAVRIGWFYAAAQRTPSVSSKDSATIEPRCSFLPTGSDLQKLLSTGTLSDEEEQRIRKLSQSVCAGHYEFRGIGLVTLEFSPDSWYRLVLHAELSSADRAMINRHDFLIPLVQAVLLFDDEVSRRKLDELIRYWISSFNTSELIRHDTAIDVAIRLINWMWALSSGVLDLPAEERRKLRDAIRIQIEYISAWRSPGGNHLVLEALASYVYGQAYPNIHNALSWSRWSRRTLLFELERQTSPDGVHTEQSMFYHQAVTNHFLKFARQAKAADDQLPAAASQRLVRMLDYVHDTMQPNCGHPVLGDGEPMTTDDREHWEARALIAARTVLKGSPCFEGFLPSISDAAVWMLGIDRRTLPTTPTAPASTVLSQSGAAALRDGPRYLYFDASPFGDPEMPHHGHADALSVTYFDGGEVIVDPGGYGYYDDEYRRYFRSTAAHNTITIDSRSQSRLFGVIGFGRLANVSLLHHACSAELDHLLGEHDGYGSVRVSREVVLRKGTFPYLLIVDHVLTEHPCECVSRFHLAADLRMKLGSHRIQTTSGDRKYTATATSSVPTRENVMRGTKTPSLAGWLSPETRRVTPTDTWEIQFSATRRSILAVLVSQANFGATASLDASGEFLEILGEHAEAKDRYRLGLDGRSAAVRLDSTSQKDEP